MGLLALGARFGPEEPTSSPPWPASGLEERETLDRLVRDGALTEAVLLRTCGRLELYAVASDSARAVRSLTRVARRAGGLSRGDASRLLRPRSDRDAVRHLFGVAAGLDSVLLGEEQILGQVRRAAFGPDAVAHLGPVTHRLFERAVRAGKRVRSATGIARGAGSLAGASVRLVRELSPDLAAKSVLVVGAGETGTLVARALAKAGVARLTIANRTPERATQLAAALGARARALVDALSALGDYDVVVGAAGGSSPLVTRERVAPLPPDRRPSVFVDLARPGCIEPSVGDLPGSVHVELDELFTRVHEGRRARVAHLPEAWRIVDQEVDAFLDWYRTRGSTAVVRRVRQSTLRRAAAEADRLSGGAPEEERLRLQRMARSIARALLHQPTVAMRDADTSTEQGRALLAHASTLFGVDAADGAESA